MRRKAESDGRMLPARQPAAPSGAWPNSTLDVIPCGYQMAGMTRRMDEQVSQQAPRTLTDGLDASVRDLTAGRRITMGLPFSPYQP
jgi:hypothetical protein